MQPCTHTHTHNTQTCMHTHIYNRNEFYETILILTMRVLVFSSSFYIIYPMLVMSCPFHFTPHLWVEKHGSSWPSHPRQLFPDSRALVCHVLRPMPALEPPGPRKQRQVLQSHPVPTALSPEVRVERSSTQQRLVPSAPSFLTVTCSFCPSCT